jgi:hypothetical protein
VERGSETRAGSTIPDLGVTLVLQGYWTQYAQKEEGLLPKRKQSLRPSWRYFRKGGWSCSTCFHGSLDFEQSSALFALIDHHIFQERERLPSVQRIQAKSHKRGSNNMATSLKDPKKVVGVGMYFGQPLF